MSREYTYKVNCVMLDSACLKGISSPAGLRRFITNRDGAHTQAFPSDPINSHPIRRVP